jgi:hypothetical protein
MTKQAHARRIPRPGTHGLTLLPPAGIGFKRRRAVDNSTTQALDGVTARITPTV